MCGGGDALFDWQGLLGHAAAGAESVFPWKDSLSPAAYRHQLQVPRDDRISRRLHAADWRGTHRAQESAGSGRRCQSILAGNAKMLRVIEDKIAARRACRRGL